MCSDRVGKDAVEGLRKGLEAIHGYLGKGIRRQEWMPRKGKPAASQKPKGVIQNKWVRGGGKDSVSGMTGVS